MVPVRTVATLSLPATMKSEAFDWISPSDSPFPSSLYFIIGEMKSGLRAPSSIRRDTFSVVAAQWSFIISLVCFGMRYGSTRCKAENRLQAPKQTSALRKPQIMLAQEWSSWFWRQPNDSPNERSPAMSKLIHLNHFETSTFPPSTPSTCSWRRLIRRSTYDSNTGSWSLVALSENAWPRTRRIRVWSSRFAVRREATLLGGFPYTAGSFSNGRWPGRFPCISCQAEGLMKESSLGEIRTTSDPNWSCKPLIQ